MVAINGEISFLFHFISFLEIKKIKKNPHNFNVWDSIYYSCSVNNLFFHLILYSSLIYLLFIYSI